MYDLSSLMASLNPNTIASGKKLWYSLTDEQKRKVLSCRSVNEVIELAGREGVAIPDELLDVVAGGYIYPDKYQGKKIWNVIDDNTGAKVGSSKDEAVAGEIAESLGFLSDSITRREAMNIAGNNFSRGGC